MATVGKDDKIKVTYHAERAIRALCAAEEYRDWGLKSPDTGRMIDDLAYDHARGAARAALNRTRKVKR